MTLYHIYLITSGIYSPSVDAAVSHCKMWLIFKYFVPAAQEDPLFIIIIFHKLSIILHIKVNSTIEAIRTRGLESVSYKNIKNSLLLIRELH